MDSIINWINASLGNFWGALNPVFVISWILFGEFHYYQTKHIQNYWGPTPLINTIMTYFAFAGTLCEYGIYIYFGYKHGLGSAVLLFMCTGPVTSVMTYPLHWLGLLRNQIAISTLGLIGAPITISLVFTSI